MDGPTTCSVAVGTRPSFSSGPLWVLDGPLWLVPTLSTWRRVGRTVVNSRLPICVRGEERSPGESGVGGSRVRRRGREVSVTVDDARGLPSVGGPRARERPRSTGSGSHSALPDIRGSRRSSPSPNPGLSLPSYTSRSKNPPYSE